MNCFSAEVNGSFSSLFTRQWVLTSVQVEVVLDFCQVPSLWLCCISYEKHMRLLKVVECINISAKYHWNRQSRAERIHLATDWRLLWFLSTNRYVLWFFKYCESVLQCLCFAHWLPSNSNLFYAQNSLAARITSKICNYFRLRITRRASSWKLVDLSHMFSDWSNTWRLAGGWS